MPRPSLPPQPQAHATSAPSPTVSRSESVQLTAAACCSDEWTAPPPAPSIDCPSHIPASPAAHPEKPHSAAVPWTPPPAPVPPVPSLSRETSTLTAQERETPIHPSYNDA